MECYCTFAVCVEVSWITYLNLVYVHRVQLILCHSTPAKSIFWLSEPIITTTSSYIPRKIYFWMHQCFYDCYHHFVHKYSVLFPSSLVKYFRHADQFHNTACLILMSSQYTVFVYWVIPIAGFDSWVVPIHRIWW